MASPVSDILNNIVETLRSSEAMGQVTVGPVDGPETVPGAAVLYEGQETFRPDDSPAARWGRVEVTVIVRTRSAAVLSGVSRAADLCETIIDALLEDPYRDGTCCDLPIGAATEIERISAGKVRRPEVEFRLAVRCHFEQEDEV
jgi:hypothetical protein